jgi:nucleotide-binding universal stress UspA family protein
MSDTSTTPSIAANQKAIISKILVAIDGSAASMDAADYATSISKKYNAELYALHVIRADLAAETSEFMTRMKKEAEEY